MINFFNSIFYKPILAILVFIYDHLAFHDLGLSIIFLTILVRVVLFPLFYKSAKDQALINRLQPKMKKIQTDFKNNKEEQARALLALYRDHRFNPFLSFFLLLVQLPIFLVLFQIFTKELKTLTFKSHALLGIINLQNRSIIIALIAAALQYFQAKLSMNLTGNKSGSNAKLPNQGQAMRFMVYMGPIFTLLILTGLPSALGIYWAVSGLFSLLQQVYINKKLSEVKEDKNQDTHGTVSDKNK